MTLETGALVVLLNIKIQIKPYSDRLDDRGVRVRFLARARECSLLHNAQTGSGAHPAFYTMGTGGGEFPGCKESEA
jgi:hypothetical protein